ncbi:MAG: hypothetical protein IT304_08980 [Dehalococcoidia bacterium]|nr:hypothetical protein [Dehalococcoidia bacterium]
MEQQEIADLRLALQQTIEEVQKFFVLQMKPATSKDITAALKRLDLAFDLTAAPNEYAESASMYDE